MGCINGHLLHARVSGVAAKKKKLCPMKLNSTRDTGRHRAAELLGRNEVSERAAGV